MANIKFRREIHNIHNEWCAANGYPVRSYKPQAGRPKIQASSTEILKRQAYIIEPVSNSVKRQAVILKLQARSCKLLDH